MPQQHGLKPVTPRQRIVDTATTLFLEHGIHAVGINRIVDEADVALMTLYRQFGGKNELVAAVLDNWSAGWLQSLIDRVDRAGDDPDTRFTALCDGLEEWLASDGFRGSFVTNAASELRGQPEHPAHEAIAAHRMAMRRFLEDLSKRAGAIDAAGLAAQLQVAVEGAAVAAALDQGSAGAYLRSLVDAARAANAPTSET